MYSEKTNKGNKVNKATTSFLIAIFLVTQLFAMVPINVFADNSGSALTCDPNVNLVKNGSFEAPTSGDWELFSSVPNWSIDWIGGDDSFGSSTRPTEGLLEIQRNVDGWLPSEGEQYAELDTDWDGPTGDINGEPASVTIWQNLETVAGKTYKVSFDFSPRPNTTEAQNVLGVSWDGSAVSGTPLSASGESNSNTDWNTHTFDVVASSDSTELRFTDLGIQNSVGTFLDNVVVNCVVPETPTNTLPTVTLIGDNPLEITLGDSFTDPGATYTDAEDDDTTLATTTSGTVDTSTLGSYILTYSVTDSGGLTDSTTRTVNVVPVPVNEFNIIASKITCENESDLPNWGVGGPDISSSTVSDFLAAHPSSCWLEEGRSFQWGYKDAAGVTDPGGHFIGEATKTGNAFNEWKTFGPTDVNGQAKVNIDDVKDKSIWVREVLTENDSVFFSEPPVINNENKDDFSAEMYCHNDVLNYDNFDFVLNPEPEHTYYCVAFNVAEAPENVPPTIDLIGADPLEIILGSDFTDPGATANDLEDGNITNKIVVTGDTVDTDTLGSYTLTYTVEDSGGLTASVNRVVKVVEINFCELIDDQEGWLGSYFDYAQSHPDMNLPAEDWGTTYGDPLSKSSSWSADWYNNKYLKFAQVDSDLDFGSNFFPMDHIEPDEGKVQGHNFYFGAHFQAEVTAPTEGDYGYYLTSDDDSWVYVDGELAIDNSGVHPASKKLGGNIHLTGTHHIVDVFFAERHISQSNLVFKFLSDDLVIKPYAEECVNPNTPPTITALGANPFNLLINNPFVDPGATATDLEDGDATTTANIITTGTVDSSTLGSYILTYSVTDSGGLGATTTREVIVYDEINPPVNTPPVVTLIGADPLEWTLGNPFTDPGATYTDAEDDDATLATTTSGTVDTSTLGSYILTYSVTDSGGLGATTTREVNVVEKSTPPVIPPGGGGGGGIGGHRHPVPEILGATSCTYLIDYLKIDQVNNPIEVLKLQSFLNVFEGESLSLTGVFNQPTFEAVERFQTKYSEDILNPWGKNVTTGYVYILTKKKVNEIYCGSLINLSQADQNEIDTFRTFGENNPDAVITNPATGSRFVPSKVGSVLSGYTGSSDVLYGENKDETESVVVNLKDNASTTNDSVLRNVAVSLFSFPKKIFGNKGVVSAILFLILVAIIAAVVRLFTNPKDSDDDPTVPPVAKTDSEKDSPIIVLPGVLPDEEIVVENPEEGPDDEVLVGTPDLTTDEEETV